MSGPSSSLPNGAKGQGLKPATIVDIAAYVGLSKSTVSNVVRGVASVAPETRQRVLEAVETLGYRPNGLARQLVRARSTTIGVVTGGLSNQFFSEMAIAVEKSARRRGYTVMLFNSEGEAEKELEGIERLLEHRVAGILMATWGSGSRARELRDMGCPVVFICDGVDWCDLVGVEDASGTTQATEHLLALGHRGLAYFSNPLIEPETARARLEGFCSAAARKGVSFLTGNFEGGRAHVGRRRYDLSGLMRARRITAVVCVNDSTALGVLDHLERDGVAVPEEISVVGFDDIPIAGLARISLTTVSQPIGAIADDAVGLLCARVEGLKGQPKVIRHKVSLVVRATTALPRALLGE